MRGIHNQPQMELQMDSGSGGKSFVMVCLMAYFMETCKVTFVLYCVWFLYSIHFSCFRCFPKESIPTSWSKVILAMTWTPSLLLCAMLFTLRAIGGLLLMFLTTFPLCIHVAVFRGSLSSLTSNSSLVVDHLLFFHLLQWQAITFCMTGKLFSLLIATTLLDLLIRWFRARKTLFTTGAFDWIHKPANASFWYHFVVFSTVLV